LDISGIAAYIKIWLFPSLLALCGVTDSEKAQSDLIFLKPCVNLLKAV
jgi:hypothetical protein